MSTFDLLQYNFDSNKYKGANSLKPCAANTLTSMTQATLPAKDWQKQAISQMASNNYQIDRTQYFKNPVASNVSFLSSNTQSLYAIAQNPGEFNTPVQPLSTHLNNLIQEINNFKDHTERLSGIQQTFDYNVPTFDTATEIGQQTIMTISKYDGTPSNTDVMLGSFTSLFTNDDLSANSANLALFVTQYVDPLNPPANLDSYVLSTTNYLLQRRNHDENFFRNCKKLNEASNFLDQFYHMGGTKDFLVNNMVGTDGLRANLASTMEVHDETPTGYRSPYSNSTFSWAENPDLINMPFYAMSGLADFLKVDTTGGSSNTIQKYSEENEESNEWYRQQGVPPL